MLAKLFLQFHLFRYFKTHKGNHTFALSIACIVMYPYNCFLVNQLIVGDSLTVYSILIDSTECHLMTSW